jgi:hypothetical protein
VVVIDSKLDSALPDLKSAQSLGDVGDTDAPIFAFCVRQRKSNAEAQSAQRCAERNWLDAGFYESDFTLGGDSVQLKFFIVRCVWGSNGGLVLTLRSFGRPADGAQDDISSPGLAAGATGGLVGDAFAGFGYAEDE